jgi:hypothetical protein
MQKIRFVNSLAVLMGCFGIVLSAAHAAPRTSVDLSSGWQFRQRMTATATPAEWRPATVPGHGVDAPVIHVSRWEARG